MKKRKKRIKIGKKAIWLAPFLLLAGCAKKDSLPLAAVELTAETDAKESGEETVPEAGVKESGEKPAPEAGAKENGEEPGPEAEEKKVCYVHICGQVREPGVYRMESGSRIYQAVKMAGGFTENAETDYVNQAEAVEDGLKITIPSKEEALLQKQEASGGLTPVLEPAGGGNGLEYPRAQAADDVQRGAQAGGLVNINTASEAELCTLTGIGSSRARAIVEYREKHGGFASPEDIMKVSGIKESSYEKIKDRITV